MPNSKRTKPYIPPTPSAVRHRERRLQRREAVEEADRRDLEALMQPPRGTIYKKR